MKNTVLVLLLALGFTNSALGQCADPTNLQASYSNNVTSFTWDAVSGASSYIIELKQPWDPWAEVVDFPTTNSYSLTGIMHSLSFDWRVKAVCTSGESNYTQAAFTVPCPQPGGLTATNITLSGATLNWTPAAGYNTFVSNFYVAYRVQGSTNWISAGSTSNPTKTLTGLQANTTYQWRVYQTCPYSNSTQVTSTFTTLGCSSAGNNATEWISVFKLGSINRNSGAESGGYVSTGLSANLSAGSSNSARIRVGNNGSFSAKRYKVYIDYNNNNVFEETEVAFGPANITSTGNINFTLNIPSYAPNGAHKLRVIMARGTSTNITGCMSGHLGETEDYMVNISGGTNKEVLSISEELALEKKLILYPNPASDVLNIDVPATATISVYDLVGKKIFTQQTPAASVQINTSNWPAAQYILHAIYSDGRVDVSRFVKQ